MRPSDRSRPFRSIPAVVEDDEPGVPDLRAKNPLRRPLTKTVKEVATLIGALVAIGGYALGGGRWLLKQADIAKKADIAAANAPIVESIKTSDRQRAKDKAEIKAELKAAQDERHALATSVQDIKRALRKMRPAQKDLP